MAKGDELKMNEKENFNITELMRFYNAVRDTVVEYEKKNPKSTLKPNDPFPQAATFWQKL
jgi:hypothetical protein